MINLGSSKAVPASQCTVSRTYSWWAAPRRRVGAFGFHWAAAPDRVQVFDVDLEQFVRASTGFVQHPPQRLLPDVEVAAGDEPVDRRA
ncbi:hypothetical protein [Nocardia xishanensis]|uniref:hypothetical protein n=1 Tax=Nocardia xishanensis TaxID=238964 RepID=UPI001FE19B78|nr:hypothetical protein [Nocardia xishanensis]